MKKLEKYFRQRYMELDSVKSSSKELQKAGFNYYWSWTKGVLLDKNTESRNRRRIINNILRKIDSGKSLLD